MSQKRIKKWKRVMVGKVENFRQKISNISMVSIKDIIVEEKVFLGLMVVGILLVFLNALNGDFVSDDYAMILNNPLIKDFKFGFSGFNSVSIANYLIAITFGVVPLAYHSFSVLLYIVVCVLGYVFCRHFFDRTVSVMTMLIFAFHPVHVEAVSWNSGKPYLFIAFYVMLAFIMLLKYLHGQGGWWGVGSAIAFVLGFCADHPRPFALFPIIFLYFLYKKEDGTWRKILKVWPIILILVVGLVAAGIPYARARVEAVNGGYNRSESLFYDPTFQYPTGISKYLQLFWAPFDLTLYHTMYVFPEWLNWTILVVYLGMIVYFYFKDRKYFFALGFLLVTLLPSMAPIKVSWLVAERYAFLPSLGFCMFLGLVLSDMKPFLKIVSPVLLFSIVVFFIVRIYSRNIDWQTNHKLWVNTCQVSPNSHNAWNNIGDDYDKLKDYPNAIKGFTQSTMIKPNYADAFHNRANILFKMGRLDLARESYNTALYYSPTLFQTYLSLIQIDLMEQKIDIAIDHVNKLLALQPQSSQAWYAAGLVMAQAGRKAEAISALQKSVSLDPTNRIAAELMATVSKN
jgi:tetratricopeptide (TPR) repeat protein